MRIMSKPWYNRHHSFTSYTMLSRPTEMSKMWKTPYSETYFAGMLKFVATPQQERDRFSVALYATEERSPEDEKL